MITREQVDANSYRWPEASVPYSQASFATPTGDRADCSGYVGGCCWGIPDKGINTESLVTKGWMHEIPMADAKPGDALGLCGPGTLGNAGHIQLFRGWTGAVGGALMIAEQAGGTSGPRHRTVKRPTPGYKFYRFRDIADGSGPAPSPEEDNMVKLIAPTTGWGKGGVFKLYPTSLGMALEGLPDGNELGNAVKLYGEQVSVANALAYGRPIEDIRAEWKAMATAAGHGGGGGGPLRVELSGTATPA